MTLRVSTAHYSTRDPDRLDITRAGCDRLIAAGKDAPGIVLAPSARLVFPTLRRMKAAKTPEERDAIWQVYRTDYLTEIDRNYRMWTYRFDDLLARPRLVLVCFCADHTRCHRSLAAAWLAEHGAVNEGEIET
jgi:uncharacterized protein YeaO (DUF488 family)